MNLDLEHIASLGPFIISNISECIYIIVTSLTIGFFLGKAYQKINNKSHIEELTQKLDKAISEKAELEKANQKILSSNGSHNTTNALTTLADLLSSNPSEYELTALFEISMKRDRSINDASDQD